VIPVVAFVLLAASMTLDGTEIRDNVGIDEGVLHLWGDTVLRACAVCSNRLLGGGVAWVNHGSLASDATTWGRAIFRNRPADLLVGDPGWRWSASTLPTTFTCSAETGMCE
jgi:hypothetical protein